MEDRSTLRISQEVIPLTLAAIFRLVPTRGVASGYGLACLPPGHVSARPGERPGVPKPRPGELMDFIPRISAFRSIRLPAHIEQPHKIRGDAARREGSITSKIFVGNLSFNTTREEVENLFAQEGPIQEVFLPTDRDTGRPRGFAFVTYDSDEDAARAVERFNGQELGGRPLRVNSADERPRRAPSLSGGGGPDFRSFGGGGGAGAGGDRFGGKPKGSRRNIRGKKRSL